MLHSFLFFITLAFAALFTAAMADYSFAWSIFSGAGLLAALALGLETVDKKYRLLKPFAHETAETHPFIFLSSTLQGHP